jgi:hypothetical protein
MHEYLRWPLVVGWVALILIADRMRDWRTWLQHELGRKMMILRPTWGGWRSHVGNRKTQRLCFASAEQCMKIDGAMQPPPAVEVVSERVAA